MRNPLVARYKKAKGITGITAIDGMRHPPQRVFDYIELLLKELEAENAELKQQLTWHNEPPKNDGRYICAIGDDEYPVICAKKFENGRWLLGEREKIQWAYLPMEKGVTQ